MTVQDALPQDIYTDEAGKLWRVVGVCYEPTVVMEEVEPSGHSSDPPRVKEQTMAVALAWDNGQQQGRFIRVRRSGGVHGGMWKGFTRIWRPQFPIAKEAP